MIETTCRGASGFIHDAQGARILSLRLLCDGIAWHRWFPVMSRIPLLLSLFAVSAFAQKAKPGPPSVVTIQTRDMTIEFGGVRAWTPQRILHQGEVITERTGFYGTVVSEEGEGIRWVGTGHNEGGVEKVEKATLTLDGQPSEFADKAIQQSTAVRKGAGR